MLSAHVLVSSVVLVVVPALRMGRHKSNSSSDPDYDCDQDGQNDCKEWDWWKAECKHQDVCEYRYQFGDYHLPHSCRCKKDEQVVTHYDCNGDGTKDCGDWDYSKARCSSGHICSYQYDFGDIHLGESCRCQDKCLGSGFASCQPQASDYDCDGDGVEECGSWDYGRASCKSLEICERKFKWGDLSFDASCRCRACAKSDPDSAAGDMDLVYPNPGAVGGSEYWARWINWADHMDTCAPWMMPTNDDDLRKLLSYARSQGYQVRPSGAGHSAGPLVTDGEDDKIMVVSLGAYTAPDGWQYELDENAKKVRVNAGWSQLDLYEKIRPLGYFMPSQTAGYFFQLSGVVANTVHGAGYRRSFIHSYVTRMRVMLYDGTVRIIQGDELKFWRNSYGLLGIIVGIEMNLVKNEKYQMYTKTSKLAEWSEQEYWKFIMQDAEADLPMSVTGTAAVSPGSRKSSAGEFFINMIVDPPAMIVYMNKENENATEPDVMSGIPANISANYMELRAKETERFAHNGIVPYGESVRKEGCPPIELIPGFRTITINHIVGSKIVQTIGQVIEPLNFMTFTLLGLPALVKTQRDASNDGYFARDAPNTLIAAYFMKPEVSWKAMNYMHDRVRARNNQSNWLNAEGFSWNQPAEFRFMEVTDDAVLQPVPPGRWFVSEVLSFPDAAATDQAWKEAFKEIEDYWINECGAIPHIGKLFGFQTVFGNIEVFHDDVVCKVYSDSTKAKFETYRQSVDPEGLFNYGLGSRLLQACPEMCSKGTREGNYCCSECGGQCGGTGCTSQPGGAEECCHGSIAESGAVCTSSEDTACMIP